MVELAAARRPHLGVHGKTAGETIETLSQVLSHYDLGQLRDAHRIARGFVNENWDLQTTRGRYFLKRRHPDLRTPALIRAQYALMAHLRQAGFPAPAVLPTVDGDGLLVLDSEWYEIQAYVEGAPYDHDRSAHFAAAAQTLGEYHARAADFDQAALHLGTLYGPALLEKNLTNLVEAWETERDAELARRARRLAAHVADLAGRFASHGALPHLVIHGDYYAGNLLFAGDTVVGVVDYDKARWQPRVVELAEALIYFASPRQGQLKHLVYPGPLEEAPFQCFLSHYGQIIPLEEVELHALPDYIRCIWLQVSLLRLWERGPRPAEAAEALSEVLTLAEKELP